MNNPNPLQSARSRVEAATAGEWEIQDGCSWRRIGTRGHDGNVLCPSTYSAKDSHPDLVAGRGEDVYANLRLIIFAVNTLKGLLSEEGQEVMARAHAEHAFKHRDLTLTEEDWSDLREGCVSGMQAAISAILGEQP